MKELSIKEQKEKYINLKNEILANKNNLNNRISLDNDFLYSILTVLIRPQYYFGKEEKSILKYLDLSTLSFKNIDVVFADFTGCNITIDPQSVLNKKYFGVTLYGNYKDKCFDNVDVRCANFAKAINVELDPQKVFKKSVIGADLTGIDFLNKNFDMVEVAFANFEYSKNVFINPQKITEKCLTGANVTGVKFTPYSLHNVDIEKTIGIDSNELIALNEKVKKYII